MVIVPSVFSVQVKPSSSFRWIMTLLVSTPRSLYVSVELPSRNTSVKAVQPLNALFPMLVTLLGISMFAKLLQFSNAEYPMLVIPSGITMLVKLVHF